jgi:hypothetical protein
MNKTEYKKLVAEYGQPLAAKALAWFLSTTTSDFRKAVHQAKYCIANEYLWRS